MCQLGSNYPRQTSCQFGRKSEAAKYRLTCSELWLSNDLVSLRTNLVRSCVIGNFPTTWREVSRTRTRSNPPLKMQAASAQIIHIELRANLARSWWLQLPDNLSGSARLSTSAQHGRKLQRVFESRVTCGQLDHKFRIWLLHNLGRSYCAEPIAGSTCAQLDHKWGFIGLTSGHDGQKFFLKIVSKSDTIFNFGPSWSEVAI